MGRANPVFDKDDFFRNRLARRNTYSRSGFVTPISIAKFSVKANSDSASSSRPLSADVGAAGLSNSEAIGETIGLGLSGPDTCFIIRDATGQALAYVYRGRITTRGSRFTILRSIIR